MKPEKRIPALVLVLALLLSLCPAAAAAAPFEDVPENAYYAPAVAWAVENGVTTGKTPTRFGPEDTVTRGQAVTFLWRAMGEPEPMSTLCPFADVKSTDYYYAPILWAVEEGITNGTGPNTFSPGKTLTRAHIVTFLWRTAGRPDDAGSSLWYTDAVNWAQGADLLSGTARAFAPNDECPRADVVTYLYRADQADVLYHGLWAKYTYVLDNCSWSEAFEKARDAGGQLVRIETPEEYETILSEIDMRGLNNARFRIGARRHVSGKEYHWVDGDNQLEGEVLNAAGSWTAPHWLEGEPSFRWDGNEETVLHIYKSPVTGEWVWNDIPDPLVNPNSGICWGYIVEFEEDDEDFFDVPVEKMNDAQMLDALDEWIDADEDGMLDEDGFIALADWPELMEYMVDSAELLKEEGLIKSFSYSEEDAYILYTLRSGLRVCYEPPILEYKDCAGAYVSSIEPMYSSGEQFNFTNTAGDSIERITGLGIGYVSGGQLKNSAATIENIKAVFEKSENGIIIWLGHGSSEEPALRVADSYDESKHKALRDKGEILVYPNGHMFLTSQWFQNELKSNCLHGSMVILGACHSLKDASISDALKNKGAGAVIGSKKKIGVLKLCDTTEQLIYALAMQDKDENYLTADEAMKKLVWRAYYGVDIFEGKLEIAFGGDWHLRSSVSGSLSGTVTDADTGKPIVGAAVTCGMYTQYTDKSGSFTIDRLDTAKEYTVKVTSDGYMDDSVTVQMKTHQTVKIALVPKGYIPIYSIQDFLDKYDGSGTPHYVLMNDIDARDYPYQYRADGYHLLNMLPEGGVLDGNGHTIYNIQYPLYGANYGTIRNLKVLQCSADDSTVEMDAYSSASFGGIASTNGKSGVIEDCSVSIVMDMIVDGGDTGGIVVSNAGTIRDCIVNWDADITYQGCGYDVSVCSAYFGGICAFLDKTGTLDHCLSMGRVSISLASRYSSENISGIADLLYWNDTNAACVCRNCVCAMTEITVNHTNDQSPDFEPGVIYTPKEERKGPETIAALGSMHIRRTDKNDKVLFDGTASEFRPSPQGYSYYTSDPLNIFDKSIYNSWDLSTVPTLEDR